MDDPESWRWIWLILTVLFFLGEMLAPGTFFLAPFGAGAAVALLLSLAGISPVISFIAFLGVSGAAFAALRPLARKLDREGPNDGIGARRLIGVDGAVLEAIPGGTDLGLVRVGREEWRAESADQTALAVGTPIRVLEVKGTRVVVWPTNRPGTPPTLPPSDSSATG